MKKILKITLTASLLAFVGAAHAQETDTTAYTDLYNQDTTSYSDNYRQEQEDRVGQEPGNWNQSDEATTEPSFDDTQVQDTRSGSSDDTNRDSEQMNSPAYPQEESQVRPGNTADQEWQDQQTREMRQGTTDAEDQNTLNDQVQTESSRQYTTSDRDSLEVGNEKDAREQFPETSSSDRGLNQESGTEGIHHNSGTSAQDQTDPVRQEGMDRNKDFNHSGDQSYNDEQPKSTGIGSDDSIGPDEETAHRDAEKALSHATDTLDYASQRNADPDRVGKKIEHGADSVDSKNRQKDRKKHGVD